MDKNSCFTLPLSSPYAFPTSFFPWCCWSVVQIEREERRGSLQQKSQQQAMWTSRWMDQRRISGCRGGVHEQMETEPHVPIQFRHNLFRIMIVPWCDLWANVSRRNRSEWVHFPNRICFHFLNQKKNSDFRLWLENEAGPTNQGPPTRELCYMNIQNKRVFRGQPNSPSKV